MKSNKEEVRYFYVDETGDPTLFDKKGKIIVGDEGISKVFIVGVAQVTDPDYVKHELNKLRTSLVEDPYFADVPSMQPNTRKTALFFHAKDDLAEVRREVFKLLPKLNVKVHVVVRRKNEFANHVKEHFRITGKKLTPNNIYDEMISRLFRNLLHKADKNVVYFSRRGKAGRNEALQKAIDRAKINFEMAYNKKSDKPVRIISAYPHEVIGLQVIDYYLWAVQRLYEKKEDRFFKLLEKDYRLIMDLDDTRNKPYGEWYSDINKLTFKKIKPV